VKLVDISGKIRKYTKNKIRELQTEILDMCVTGVELTSPKTRILVYMESPRVF
jgi:hypothetical protein